MTVFSTAELAGGTGRVPAAPGVYVFLGPAGEALYVGKSKDLRARLASYFRPAAREERKVRGLTRASESIRIERTGSELAALLREIELVQGLDPPYNRRLRRPERYAYVGVDYRDPFPLLVVTDAPWEGGKFLGPFPQVRRARRAVEVIADAFGLRTCETLPVDRPCWRQQVASCSAPCVGGTTPGRYGRNLLRALLALAGRSRAAIDELAAERDRLAALQRFEDAGRRQRRIEAIRQVRRLLYVTETSPADVVVVQPGPEPGAIRLWVIVGGAIRAAGAGVRRELDALFAHLWRTLDEPAAPAPLLVSKQELDARWVARRWLASPDGGRWSIPIRGRSRAAVWQETARLADAAAADLFT